VGSDCQALEGSVRRRLSVCACVVVVNSMELGKKKLFLVGKNLLVMIAGGKVVALLLLAVFVFPSFEILWNWGFACGFVFSSTYNFSFHTLAHGPVLYYDVSQGESRRLLQNESTVSFSIRQLYAESAGLIDRHEQKSP